MKIDAKAEKVLRALHYRRRPYTEADIARVTSLSKAVVRRRCQRLDEAGLIRARWLDIRGPFWEPVPPA